MCLVAVVSFVAALVVVVEGLADRVSVEEVLASRKDWLDVGASGGVGLSNATGDCGNDTSVSISTVWLPISGGGSLRACLYLPLGSISAGSLGLVMERTPYGVQNFAGTAVQYVHSYGAAVVTQDDRGRFGSGGSWEFFAHTPQDAAQLVQWAVSQEWSNGRVAVTGISADAMNAYLGTFGVNGATGNITVVAGEYVVGTADAYGLAFPNGVFRESLVEGWSEANAMNWKQIWNNESFSEWWAGRNTVQRFEAWEGVTGIHLMGSFDIFGTVQWNTFHSILQASTKPQYLILAPGGHCAKGQFDWPGADDGFALAVQLSVSVFRATLYPNQTKHDPDTPQGDLVTYYVMGDGDKDAAGNFWASGDSLPTATPTPLFLAPQASLSLTPPPSASSTAFQSTPLEPIPSLGGANLMLKKCGPWDQALQEVEFAHAQSLFTSDPLPAAVAVCGMVEASVFVSSPTATDTAVALRLEDVYPPDSIGYEKAMLVQDSAATTHWRLGRDAIAPPLQPNQPVNLTLQVGPTCWIFPKHHRIRVAVASSNADRFQPTANTYPSPPPTPSNPPGYPPYPNNATIHVHLGPQTPSHIALPVVAIAQIQEHRKRFRKARERV